MQLAEKLKQLDLDKKSIEQQAIADQKELVLKNKLYHLKNKQKYTYIYIIFIICIAIAVVASVYFYKQKSILKAKQEKVQIEQTLLRSQMNPHFIFNVLETIQVLIIENNNKSAVNYMNQFSKLIRNVLEYNTSEFVTLEEEEELLRLYLSIYQLVTNFEYDFEINVDLSLNKELTKVPPMLIQPFVENAIKHAFVENQAEKYKLKINIDKVIDKIRFTIEDNGIGIARATQNKATHKSLALQITLNRLEYIYKKATDIEMLSLSDIIDDKETRVGTRVSFTIPMV